MAKIVIFKSSCGHICMLWWAAERGKTGKARKQLMEYDPQEGKA